MTITDDDRLQQQVREFPYPLIFATISGAHLYGFPSPDSDFDLRGVHVLPVHEVVGLQTGSETVERSGIRDGMELDLVTHDVKKFMGLMLKKNGYVLEQLLSPLIVYSTEEHRELISLAPGCLTRHHVHHYLGFADTQWNLFTKEEPRRVKPLLYVYRVLLTGIHLMRSGIVNANLVELNEEYRLPYLREMIQHKLSGPEKGTISSDDWSFHQREYDRLRKVMIEANEQTHLPDSPTANQALNDLLIRIRLKTVIA